MWLLRSAECPARSVLAHAYEERQPLVLRLVELVKDRFGSDTTRTPVIQSLNIDKKEGFSLKLY